jgi:hypothetical protein
MSRLYAAIARLSSRGDRAAIGVVVRYLGAATYRVRLAGTEYDVPAVGEAQALDGQSVAVIVSGASGQPMGVLGVVGQSGVE